MAPITYDRCEGRPAPEVREVRPQASPEDTFVDYARRTPDGWTGGDSTYSLPLPDGRLLWIFSDTFLGPLNRDGTRPTTAKLVNNSFVLQDGDRLTTITGGTRENPEAIMPPSAEDHWYWAGDGTIATIGGTPHLQVVFVEYRRFGPGAWDYRFHRTVVATFDLDRLDEPLRVDDLPSSTGVAWGSALLPPHRSGDGHTYVYGVSDAATHKTMRIARVEGSDLTRVERWQYANSARRAWMRAEHEATDVLAGVANEYSVTPWNGGFVLISQDSTEPFSTTIRLWYGGCAPYGPFRAAEGEDEVHRMPEPGASGTYGDPDVIGYNAHVHPGLRRGDRWTLSYNVNSLDDRTTPDGAHYRDPGIYRPRFVSFRLVPSAPARRP
ncbi:hypothetical protein [Streptomyces sp. URMC 123]|uniref:hypothetical protein n=1 Tax=Streptomyces sp. URMC 123 TaxID=3423403 RepID=UPI003F19477F